MHAHASSVPPLRTGARLALAISGVLLLAIGTAIFVGPLAYQADMGVTLPNDPTLLSDLRAMGGGLVGFGLLLVAGAKWRALGSAAAVGGAILYLSYGIARLISMAVDGLPADTLVVSAGIELLVGGVLALVIYREAS